MLSYSRPAMEKVSGASKYLFAVVALYIYIYIFRNDDDGCCYSLFTTV